jgi:predicted nucleotidyltransferase
MNNLLDLSGKIDPLSVALFTAVSETAGSLGIAFFVVGATARDMIFELGHGRPSRRATLDRDFGVRVESWAEFGKLKESLLTSRLFEETRDVQRLRFRGGLDVDIVPFGGIADNEGAIRWPPDEDVVISTVGFEDAYRTAQRVRVKANPPLDILVASIPGLTILKLISWADRPHGRSRDAIDLVFILERYLDAGNTDRLFEEHIDLVEVADFDYDRAGARLLGRDIAKISAPETIKRIREILANETSDEGRHSRLIPGMMPRGTEFEAEGGNRFNQLLTLLLALLKGIDDW